MNRKRVLASLGLLLAVTACGDSSSSPADAGAELDAGPADGGGMADGAGPLDAGSDASTECAADGNDTPDTAADAMLGSADGVRDAIACPGDVDYFAFDGAEQQYVRLYVRPRGQYMGERVDPVLTLYDPDGAVLAENDDGMEGIGVIGNHPLIVTRLPVTGRYVVRVDEYEHWSEMGAGKGAPTLTYDLYALVIDDDSDDAVVDPEDGDDAASAIPMRSRPRTLGGTPIEFGYAVGDFEDDSDVDVFSFEITATEPTALFGATMHLPGPEGSGATVRTGHLWVTDATGAEIIGRTDTSEESGLVRVGPSLPSGSHLLWIDRSDEPAGANDFYAVAVSWTSIDNPRESDDAGNGVLAGAEPLDTSTGGGGFAAFLSFITPGDVDYFSFELSEVEALAELGCSAAWEGSGLRGLRMELRDASDSVLAAAVEDDALPNQVALDEVDYGTPPPGTYYLRLTASGQDADVTGNWVRCGIRLDRMP